MANDTITLVIDGNVRLEDLATAIEGWREVLKGLGSEVKGAEHVPWELEYAAAGSFNGTLRAIYRMEEREPVEEVVRRYTKLGRDMRIQSIGSYSPIVRSGAGKIASVIGDRVPFVRFETDEDDAEIHAPLPLAGAPASVPPEPETAEEFRPERKESVRQSYGMVRGQVQNLTSRRSLRFTLYESNSERAVSCYVLPGNEDIMRDAWGKTALVAGIVRRDPFTGHPTTIREVRTITILPQAARGGWREAIGCAPGHRGDPLPEESIRRLRDAE